MSKALVLDSLAAPGTFRVHELPTRYGPDGKTVTEVKPFRLSADVPLEMDMNLAMQFLKDKAFIVMDEDGNRVEPVPVQKDGGTGSLVLLPNEIIANLDELKTGALYKRCKVGSGSDKITEESSRESMIAFLVGAATPANVSTNADVAQAMAAAGVDSMEPKALNALFGDD